MRPLGQPLLSCVVFLFFFLIIVDATIEVYDSFGRKIDSFQDRETRFDDDIAMIEGFITLADPPDACSSIAEPTYLTNFTVGRFVLINGTEKCRLRTKVNNAEQAGFDLVVVFDPTPPYIHIVPYPGLETNIPVIFVSFEDGMTIKSNYLYNNSYLYNYKLRVKPNNPDIMYYMWLFGAVIGVCFFVMILFMICLLIKCVQERRKSRRNRLSSRQIRQIPTAKFAKGDQFDVCAICLENYNEGDKLRILPCSHAYHAKCIDPWLMNNRRNCPLCKRKITFGDSADDSDSEDSELTSPAENTPLLSSPSTRGQTWGTFVNPVLTVNGRDSAGPSSLPDTFQYSENSLPSSVSTTAIVENVSRRLLDDEDGATAAVFENSFRTSSKEDLESLLPPAHSSVNTSKVDNVIEENAAVVHVTINNSETANTLHGLSV